MKKNLGVWDLKEAGWLYLWSLLISAWGLWLEATLAVISIRITPHCRTLWVESTEYIWNWIYCNLAAWKDLSDTFKWSRFEVFAYQQQMCWLFYYLETVESWGALVIFRSLVLWKLLVKYNRLQSKSCNGQIINFAKAEAPRLRSGLFLFPTDRQQLAFLLLIKMRTRAMLHD